MFSQILLQTTKKFGRTFSRSTRKTLIRLLSNKKDKGINVPSELNDSNKTNSNFENDYRITKNVNLSSKSCELDNSIEKTKIDSLNIDTTMKAMADSPDGGKKPFECKEDFGKHYPRGTKKDGKCTCDCSERISKHRPAIYHPKTIMMHYEVIPLIFLCAFVLFGAISVTTFIIKTREPLRYWKVLQKDRTNLKNPQRRKMIVINQVWHPMPELDALLKELDQLEEEYQPPQ